MSEDRIRAQLRAAFQREYIPPSPGLAARMTSALHKSSDMDESSRSIASRLALEGAAAILALVAVAALTLPKVLGPTSLSAPARPLPTTTAPKIGVFSPQPATLQVAGRAEWLFLGRNAYRTTDDGMTWLDVSPTDVTGATEVAAALDGNHAWVATSAPSTTQSPNHLKFLSTVDAGSSWKEAGNMSVNGSPRQLTFVDQTHGWMLVSLSTAVDSEMVAILGTKDGGGSWTQLAVSAAPAESHTSGQITSKCLKTGLSFKDEATGWLTVNCSNAPPYVYKTTDGGRTWQIQQLVQPQGATSGSSSIALPPLFLASDFGLLAVHTSTISRTTLVIYVTHDGGQTWTITPPIVSGTSVAVVSPDHWIAVVPPRSIYVTTDGRQYTHLVSDVDLSLVEEMAFSDPVHGIALVGQVNGWPRLMRTSDTGAHWSPIALPG